MFAEFLPFIWVFPGVHTCVGSTSSRVRFSGYLGGFTLPSEGDSLVVGGRSVPTYTCVGGEGRFPLVTHSSRVSPKVYGTVW